MQHRSTAYRIATVLVIQIILSTQSVKPEEALMPSGILIEGLVEGSALAEAGFLPGDILLSYKRLPNPPTNPKPASGALGSVADWNELVTNQAPRGVVRLQGIRENRPIEIKVTGALWDTLIRPFLTTPELDIYQESRSLLAAGSLKRSAELLLNIAQETKRNDLSCWFLTRIGEDWALTKHWQEAQDAYVRALNSPSCAEKEQPLLWDALGQIKEKQNQPAEAEQYYRKALILRADYPDLSLDLAKSYANIARCAWSRKDFAGAESADKQVFRIRERLAPESLPFARTLLNLGAGKLIKRDYKAAEEFLVHSLRILEKVDPKGLHMAMALSNLGILATDRGQSETALEYQTQALTIRKEKAPNSLELATSLNAIGSIFFQERRLDEAHNYYLQALQIVESIGKDREFMGMIIGNIGLIYLYRNELDRAEDYFSQASELTRSVAPDGLKSIDLLNHIGTLQMERGNWQEADRYFKKVLQIAQKNAPETTAEASAYTSLGVAAFRSHRLEIAHRYHSRALAINQRCAPESIYTANSIFNLGSIARLQGKHKEAITLLNRALRIEERVSPDSDVIAETLYILGSTYRDMNRPGEAVTFFFRAIESLEAQILRLGGALEIRSSFREINAPIFRDLIDTLVKLERYEDAFTVLERSRGYALLEMLPQRNVSPAPIDLDKEYESLQTKVLEAQKGRNIRNLDSLLHKLRQSWTRRAEALEIVRRNQKNKFPVHRKAMDFNELRQALDTGTLVMSFSVGEKHSNIFIYSMESNLRIIPVDIGEADLRIQINQFKNLLLETRNKTASALGRQVLLKKIGAELYDLLIKPAEAEIQNSQRILILPDNPLNSLPWGALVRSTAHPVDSVDQYLGTWKPIHIALSGTIYAEIKRSRPVHPEPLSGSDSLTSIAAFATPSYPHDSELPDLSTTDFRVRSMLEDGFDFSPLPAAKSEVEGIAQLFPGKSRIFLDNEASEENVKSLSRSTRIVHFATHATLDELLPLNSAVVLSIPEKFEEGKDNGLLQAWEIFERVRLDADLVVLSACESGLGKEMGGEGLIGLTRAFQYAGARSVMASLWKISDRTTAELMVRFYKHLKAGLSKDEALRAAQMELIRGPIQVKNEKGEVEESDASAPYYWAAFQIYGDWQ